MRRGAGRARETGAADERGTGDGSAGDALAGVPRRSEAVCVRAHKSACVSDGMLGQFGAAEYLLVCESSYICILRVLGHRCERQCVPSPVATDRASLKRRRQSNIGSVSLLGRHSIIEQ